MRALIKEWLEARRVELDIIWFCIVVGFGLTLGVGTAFWLGALLGGLL